MTGALDTSVLVRILSGRPQPLADAIACAIYARIRGGDSFRISNLVLSEAYYALQYHYGIEKAAVLNAFRTLSEQEGFLFTSEAMAALSLTNAAHASPGFVDRLIHGEQHADGITVFSCEKSFSRLPDTVVLS